jgi:outer membrane protein OmpA-like peptidoglycan-associated protein
VLDADDACPLEPGEVSEKGCKPRVSVSAQGELVFSEQILFEPNKDIIVDSGAGILSAIAKTLVDRPEINRVRVEGHTDSSGGVALNEKLSRMRAKAVAEWLIAHEVAASRLLPVGCGPNHPIADNTSDEGRTKNRRVMFQVIDPVPSEAERAKTPKGCQVVRLKGAGKAPAAKTPAPATP